MIVLGRNSFVLELEAASKVESLGSFSVGTLNGGPVVVAGKV